MEMVHRELAKAKVNLTIDVLEKRADGFHEMKTRMAPISLADELEFYEANSYTLECETDGVPLDESNLVSRAVKLFERETGIDCIWRVKLVKNVPHGAGLGGGSADAAAVMRGLNKLTGANLTNDRMAELLSEIGSDVPFFVYESVCDCSGRGEIVVPVEWEHEVTMLLLKPSFGVSTPDAYRAWKDATKLPGIDYSKQVFEWGEMYNDLEKPVFMKHRFLAEMKCWLNEQAEVEGAMMSGSGSTFMAVIHKTDTEAVMERAKHELDPTLWSAVVELG